MIILILLLWLLLGFLGYVLYAKYFEIMIYDANDFFTFLIGGLLTFVFALHLWICDLPKNIITKLLYKINKKE